MNEPRWRRYLRFWRADSRRDVDDELQFHFAQRVAEFEAAGVSHEEAVSRARQRFGDAASVRTELVNIDQGIMRRRDASVWRDALAQDLRYAIRSLRRQPVFVAAVVVTLALAVGANLTTFSLIDALFFRPPAGVADAGSLRRVYLDQPNLGGGVVGKPIKQLFSYDEFRSIRDATRGIARVAIDYSIDSMDVAVGQSTTVTGVSYASADFLPMLGVRIERGRTFSESDDDVSAPADVAVVSRTFANRVFGESVEPLGADLRIRGRAYRVIGVSSSEFSGLGLSAMSVWIPFSTRRNRETSSRGPWYSVGDVYIPLVIRLEHGADAKAFATRATVSYQRIHGSARDADVNAQILAAPIQEARGPGNPSREEMIAPRIAVVAVLLFAIACANVANLLLARSWTRRREFAVRAALGISRSRLAMLVLVEATLLAVVAGTASLLLSHWAGRVLRTQLLPRVQWSDPVLAPRVMLFGAVVTFVAALLAGAAPAVVVARGMNGDALRSSAFDGGARRNRLRSALIVIQAALAVILVVGAALFGKSLRNVRGVALGYDADRLVVASVFFPDPESQPASGARLAQVAERITRLAGVSGAVATYGGPLDMWAGSPPLYRIGADSAHPIANSPNFIAVPPDYFRVAGTRILEGRGFLPSDRRAADPVIVIGVGMAKELWPNHPALGQCLRPGSPSAPCYRVIGVAADAHQFHIVTAHPETQYYFALEQMPGTPRTPRTIMARVTVESADVVAATIRTMLRDEFPTAEGRAIPMVRALEPEVRPWVLGAHVLAALSGLALIIAVIGVYAMAAFEARQRIREIGVRIALGARASDVVSLLVRQGSVVVAIGVVIGGAAAIAGGRLVESVLFGVSSRDPASIIGASSVLLGVAALAAFVPSWRAAHVDPVVVLKSE